MFLFTLWCQVSNRDLLGIQPKTWKPPHGESHLTDFNILQNIIGLKRQIILIFKKIGGANTAGAISSWYASFVYAKTKGISAKL